MSRTLPVLTPRVQKARGVSVHGFTLLEVLTAVVIMVILTLLAVQASAGWRVQAEKVKCVSNLSSLYTGAHAYLQEQEHWPQIPGILASENESQFASLWYAALGRYGVPPETFVCPTVQRTFSYPDLRTPGKGRVDYLATPFDINPGTPFRWATQPWFIEKSSSHPGGNLLIYSSGRVVNLKEVFEGRHHK